MNLYGTYDWTTKKDRTRVEVTKIQSIFKAWKMAPL